MHSTQNLPIEFTAGLVASFYSDLLGCRSFGSLNISCLRFASKYCLKTLVYHHLPQLGSLDGVAVNVISVGFPKKLADRFESQNLIGIEPSIRQVMSGTRGHRWRETEYTSGTPHSEELDYLNSASNTVGEGLMLPVFGPNGRNGYVSLGFGKTRPNMDDTSLSLLQSCCQFAHLKYCELLQVELPRNLKLSAREKEILSWVARGKSNGVVADIVGISESTVVTYLERAFKKLDVDNRVTAALRALSSGQLSYLP